MLSMAETSSNRSSDGERNRLKCRDVDAVPVPSNRSLLANKHLLP